jgi:membrane protein involved in colicin uptake
MQDLTKHATIDYEIIMDTIAVYADSTAGLEATTKEGYELVRSAIADCRGMRGKIERKRKELKKDALEYGRAVDGAARQLKEAIEAIELPLKEKKAAIDDAAERERERKRAEAAAKVEAELQAEREAEQARIAAEMADLKRRQEEADRIAAEATARAQAAEEMLAAEKANAEAERRAAAKAEAERLEAELEAKAAAEAERLAAKEAAERAVRVEAMRPDAEKLAAYADALESVKRPSMVTAAGHDALDEAGDLLITVTRSLRSAGEVA